MAKVIEQEAFDGEVLASDVPVLVDFYATWCGPCKLVAPFVDAVATDNEGKAKVFKVDVDQSGGIADRYNVRSVPTLMFFKNGDVADKIIGAAAKEAIEAKLQALM